MSVSGTVTFTQSRDQLIQDAYQLIGWYGLGRQLSAEDVTFASNMLNKMLKAWEGRSLHLWTKAEAVLYPTQYTGSYAITESDVYCTDATTQVVTQTSATAAAGASLLTVSSTTGMSAGMYIGVQLSTGALQWSTISVVNSSTTVTMVATLTSSVNSLAMVYSFATMLPKPLRIINARLVRGFDNGSTSTLYEIPLKLISYDEYFSLPVKTVNGVPNQLHYNPQVSTGMMYLWPRPTVYDQRIHFSYERAIDDMTLSSDNFDVPQEWLECITYQLAIRLGPACGKFQRTQELIPAAQSMLHNLLEWDTENTSVFLSPNRRN